MAQISSGPVGILPGQSMFETDSTRKGILEARESFVRMVNVVFERTAIAVERPDAVAALDSSTPIPEFMIWRQKNGERHVQTIPASSEYDEQVYSIEERDSLLLDPKFRDSLLTATRRVLVNGLNNDVPQWSVWHATAPAEGVDANTDPEIIFSLARAYDFPRAGEDPLTKAQRNLLLQSEDGEFTTGSRVLVQGDSTTGGFWTVWEYAPSDASADEFGFILCRTQTYRTRDFWEFVDWYAEGYDVANPPVVRYATAAARNAAENPIPNTKFVRLDDDGNGRWVWTVFANGAWNIVAREKGTIRLSEKLYDPTRELLFEPLAPIPTADRLRRVFNREGSWELRILIDALRDHGAFTDLEINEVFFSMLHFVHSQQDQVSWAFKTSFLNIGGYNESLRPVPVQPVDNTQNLLDYIEEVKPYRVKTRDFTRVVTPDIDVANLQVTDFDLPPYYEETTGKYRILSIGNPADLEIIKTQRPWKDWYDNYQKTLLEPEYYEATQFNPVRHMNIKMTFDRVDHMPLITEEFFKYKAGDDLHFDTRESVDNRLVEVYINREKVKAKFVAGTGNRVFISTTPPADADVRIVIRQGLSFLLAADRAQRFYNPVLAEKNIRALLGLEPKIGVLDGGGFGDGDADYQVQIGAGYEEYNTGDAPMHYGLSDPLHSGDRPEELVVVGASEGLTIKVTDISTDAKFIMATARPGMDLMAPKETGDFDARPLNDIAHDVGVVGGSNPATMITVNSVDLSAIKAAVASVIDPSLLIIRKIKNGPQWSATEPYKAGAVVRNGNNLYKARVDVIGGQVTTLTKWSPYGSPLSMISISEQSILPSLMTALSSFNPAVSKQVADTPIFVQRSDSWEFIRLEDEQGTLSADLAIDDTEITIAVSGPMPFTPPTYQKVAKSKKKSKDKDALTDGSGVKKIIEKPGVVWINGERIEFYDYAEGEGTVILRELRRGTHGTKISVETRAVNREKTIVEDVIIDGSFPRGDGTTKTFWLRNPDTEDGSFEDLNNLDVVLHGALKEADGTVRVMDFYAGYDVFLPQLRDVDFTAKRESDGIRVTFAKAPENNVEVIIAKTSSQVHKAGSGVSDGRDKFDIRPDQAVGGMVFY